MQRGVGLGITLKNFVTSFKTVSTLLLSTCMCVPMAQDLTLSRLYLCRSQDVVSHISIVKTDP